MTIQKGWTKNVGTAFWQICDMSGKPFTSFIHASFPHLLSGVEVYCIDLNLDPSLCENVQLITDVDNNIGAATGNRGIDISAEKALRNYVMQALLHGLTLNSSDRTGYLNRLMQRMITVNRDAMSKGTKITMAILKANRIV